MRARCLSLLVLHPLAVAVAFAAPSILPPKADLPAGLELLVAAAPPLVTHPIMGCLDDRGRLYLGDAAGKNLNRAALEQQLPNRVLRLVDTDGDGVFDRVTVFADRMTFPQGGAWLNGSLYVASPPGIWKLTDTNDDGVADQREMIVGGFDFDGNAADVHGPFLHPTDGRLYWCHGRKGHKVVQRDGTLVHEGKASGVWSCRPDGSDVQWHALGGMDNPVELDFAPDGQIFGVVNLHFNQPRQDTLVHWLYGGVYARPDQLAVLAGLPRTVEHLPVVHNYGHVAVSGSTFYRTGTLNPAWRGDLFVTFFNSQKVVRTHLAPAGATFTATQHEFLKFDDPDIHLTDVIEDRDGSLLVLNTGGWFRLGCPTSLTEKPDLRGAVYRVRATKPSPALAPLPAPPAVALTSASDAPAQLRACEALARAKTLSPADRTALLALLAQPLDAALEHAAMFAALATRTFALADVTAEAAPALTRRLLVILDQTTTAPAARASLLALAERHATAADPALASTAIGLVARHPASLARLSAALVNALEAPAVPRSTLSLLTALTTAQLATPAARDLVTRMLAHASAEVRTAAWHVLAEQPGKVTAPAWLPPVEKDFASAREADLPLLLDVIAKLDPKKFAPALRALVADEKRPPTLRLKALAALAGPNDPLDDEAFALLVSWSQPNTHPLPRMESARLLARARLTPAQLTALAPLVGAAGPIELREFLKLVRRLDAALAQTWADALVRSPVFGSLEESVIKSAFSVHPAALYERTLAPAIRAGAAAAEAKHRLLERLAANLGRGRVSAGENVFEFSACVACHHVGPLGRVLGPDLTHIGRIRQPRDLLESILFPDATIARDFETHAIETTDGQSILGVQQSAGESFVFVDLAGRETTLRPAQIATHTVLPTSLMPSGLEQTFNEQQLLDLVAWLAAQR